MVEKVKGLRLTAQSRADNTQSRIKSPTRIKDSSYSQPHHILPKKDSIAKFPKGCQRFQGLSGSGGGVLISSRYSATSTWFQALERLMIDGKLYPGIFLEWLSAGKDKVGSEAVHWQGLGKAGIEIVERGLADNQVWKPIGETDMMPWGRVSAIGTSARGVGHIYKAQLLCQMVREPLVYLDGQNAGGTFVPPNFYPKFWEFGSLNFEGDLYVLEGLFFQKTLEMATQWRFRAMPWLGFLFV